MATRAGDTDIIRQAAELGKRGGLRKLRAMGATTEGATPGVVHILAQESELSIVPTIIEMPVTMLKALCGEMLAQEAALESLIGQAARRGDTELVLKLAMQYVEGRG